MSDTAPLVVVVSGPSGAGKSTVLSRVLGETDRLRFSVSHTSRAPRPGERDGVDYHFVTAAEFHRLRAEGRFLEWAEVHGDLKGTGCGEYERADRDQVDLLLDLDVQGAAQLRLKFPDAVTAFILPPSWEVLAERLRGRGSDSGASLARRLANAAEETRLYREYQYVIINDDLERSVSSLKSIIRAARCRTARLDPQAQAIVATFPSPKEHHVASDPA
ncbi:MAG TPA: guanylate kinase [Vicinamibacteria bacterium]|nr:guanylate kinase [Vicinamibacteria bacterium]